VGNTPLIELKSLSILTGCKIMAKCEHLNPTGSVKDRAALWIVEDAEKNGTIKPGGTIVEGTSGNTGIALAMVASMKGYKCEICIPDYVSIEKQ
jgi:cysteine synthase A